MKLERTHEYLVPVFVILGTLVLAIVTGSSIGSGQERFAFGVMGIIIVTAFFLSVRQKVWMLIPMTWMLGGKITLLPLPVSVAQVAVLFAFGTFLLLKAFKVVRIKPKIGLVEFWMLINLFYLLTVYLRNPVGVEALGSDRVGGKPYFDTVVACCAYWVLARSVATPKEGYVVPLLSVAGHGLAAWLNAIAYQFPFTVQPLAQIYSGIAAAENPDAVAALEKGSRHAYLLGLGGGLANYAIYRWRPFTVINPIFFGRFFTFSVAFSLILMTGFRSALITLFLGFLWVTFFRDGIIAVFRVIMVVAAIVGLLISMQGNLIDLPQPAQRALSFLPGKWDYSAKREAEASTEWRVEMWKTILTSDKYIANKWLGDGFGFTRYQFQVMAANARGTTLDQQENLMISGGVHSGPISAIRFVGYVGLLLFLVLLILAKIRAYQLIRRAEGTPFYFFALFCGMPMIVALFVFVLIFGGFEGDLPNTIVAIGMLKLLENSLAAHESERQGQDLNEIESVPKMIRAPDFVPAAR